ncbi:hypothetical protein ACFQI7_26600 [Paenibacillus allorhizosphaerae]|uniref:Exo-alpha-sialidase n=1 Tax=Paenibacillus allorhizosphaerae TaxID=2849866 RepID=A0ABM8VM50_9BACL|nr:hypothetical protein [Paenibacillus allorhizosphaerae]CAG7649407.1 hypothetical protein PAECIP111802_04482 [Paenibacillus allorhizosphaerae]
MKLPLPAKRARTWAMIALAIMVLLFNAGFPSTPAEAANSVKAKQIVQHGYMPMVLDDQGNVWVTSISSRAYRMNLLPFRSHLVKAEHMDRIATLNAYYSYAVKDDGTVWTMRTNPSSEQDKDKWGLYTTKLGVQLPYLKNIVKVTSIQGGILALDRDGKLWILKIVYRSVSEGTQRIELPPLFEEQPLLVEGVDQVKDLSFTLILKEDGTVWSQCFSQSCPSMPEQMATTPPVQIQGLEDIIKVDGDTPRGIALKKTGRCGPGDTVIGQSHSLRILLNLRSHFN